MCVCATQKERETERERELVRHNNAHTEREREGERERGVELLDLAVPVTAMTLRVLKEPVVPVYVQFSRDKYIMDGPPEKLRRELEEELKLASEEPRSHAWYHGAIPRQVGTRRTHHCPYG